MRWVIGLVCLTALLTQCALGQEIELRMIHLRSGMSREWAEFPEVAQGAEFDATFVAEPNTDEATLSVRQQDVKQTWRVLLNEKPLGNLVVDENDMRMYFTIPAGALKSGNNRLQIVPTSRQDKTTDDIRVGEIRVDRRRPEVLLNAGTVTFEVVDADSGKPLPCRITLLDEHGSLQTTGTEQPARQAHVTHSKAWLKALSDRAELPALPTAGTDDARLLQMAIRAGTVFSATGNATLGLPTGRYVAFVGRGFEYSLERVEFKLPQGGSLKHTVKLRREVPTQGLIACDTHSHTLSYSGHGDAMLTERLVTIAAEGLELPAAADHNVHVDYELLTTRLNLRQHFTPLIGNEVTTSVGHFNIFPIKAGSRVVDHKQTDWGQLFDSIYATPGVRVAVLNHARDLHSNVRPFGPKLFNEVVGENIAGWPQRFNAMETVNSGTTQYDPLQLFHDWMSLLNRGLKVVPIGSSDSHDVARHFVGQGRTYIRGDDRDVSQIPIDATLSNLIAGRAMVSYGLLTELKLQKHAANETAIHHEAAIRVLGPHWVKADRVRVYVNGELLREVRLDPALRTSLPRGVIWNGTVDLPQQRQDAHVVAIALGPGVDGTYWKTAKPYQWHSEEWTPHVIGCSEAVWIDADGDGQHRSAREYAQRAIHAAAGDDNRLMQELAKYDAVTASHAAHLIENDSKAIDRLRLDEAIKSAASQTRTGFERYREAKRQTERAREMSP